MSWAIFFSDFELAVFVVVAMIIIGYGSQGKIGPAYLITFFMILIGWLIGIPHITTGIVILLFLVTAFIVAYDLFLSDGGGRVAG